MKIKILMSALATAFTVSVAEAAQTTDVQSQIDQLKAQISSLENKVQSQGKTIKSEQEHLAEEEKEFDGSDDGFIES